MKNVHLLPTDKLIKSAGDLVKDKYGSIHIFTKNDGKEYGKTTTKLNIYITDNSEIKEGNYVVVDCSEIEIEEVRLVIGYYNEQFLFDDRGQIHMDYCKKVILTTDQDLIKDGVQAIDYEFLQWFVKNPSCEWVEVMPIGFEDRDDYLIMIPQEEPKQETLEEAAEIFYSEQSKAYEDATEPMFDNSRYLVAGFIEGANWQAERMYSEKEVIAIVEKSRETGLTAEYLLLTDQFKKK